MKPILSPSVLAADFARLAENIKCLEEEQVPWLHLDVMDGMFVKNISFGTPVIASLRKASPLFFDVHMMVKDPVRYVPMMKEAGADLITVHFEATEDVRDALLSIKNLGLKAGLALSPDTPAKVVEDYIELTDMVLIMSVYPGFGGQSFLPNAFEKLRLVRELARQRKPELLIEVDGGVNKQNLKDCLSAGANVIVAGSAIFKEDIRGNCRELLGIMGESA